MGQMRWFRLDCDIDQLPKARKAGYGGVAIWLALARVSAQFDLGNRITPEFADPEFLADHLRTTADRISADIAAAIRAGLVSLDADGSLVLDMDRFLSPDTAKKRVQRAAAAGTVPDCPGLSRTTGDGSGLSLYRTGQNRTDRTDRTGQEHDLENDPTLGGVGHATQPPEATPQAATPPATTAKTKKPDPLKHITLNESTWAFDGITNEDRAAWAKDAPHVNVNRELAAMIAYAQTHPGKLASWRKGGRWVSTIAAWMIRAQQFAEKRPGGTATVPRKQDDPTRDRYGREYSSVRMARELGITVGGA